MFRTVGIVNCSPCKIQEVAVVQRTRIQAAIKFAQKKTETFNYFRGDLSKEEEPDACLKDGGARTKE